MEPSVLLIKIKTFNFCRYLFLIAAVILKRKLSKLNLKNTYKSIFGRGFPSVMGIIQIFSPLHYVHTRRVMRIYVVAYVYTYAST